MTMIDVTSKPEIFREATAKGIIRLKSETVQMIREQKIAKGDPLNTAKIAGVLAAKKTSTLIPFCHNLALTHVDMLTKISNANIITVSAKVKTNAQTGVEMEALMATTVALLTIWDMVKQYEKDAEGQYPLTEISNIQVVKKVKQATHRKSCVNE